MTCPGGGGASPGLPVPPTGLRGAGRFPARWSRVILDCVLRRSRVECGPPQGQVFPSSPGETRTFSLNTALGLPKSAAHGEGGEKRKEPQGQVFPRTPFRHFPGEVWIAQFPTRDGLLPWHERGHACARRLLVPSFRAVRRTCHKPHRDLPRCRVRRPLAWSSQRHRRWYHVLHMRHSPLCGQRGVARATEESYTHYQRA